MRGFTDIRSRDISVGTMTMISDGQQGLRGSPPGRQRNFKSQKDFGTKRPTIARIPGTIPTGAKPLEGASGSSHLSIAGLGISGAKSWSINKRYYLNWKRHQ
jgi:hypothetical protein